jgi:hypothetical protein
VHAFYTPRAHFAAIRDRGPVNPALLAELRWFGAVEGIVVSVAPEALAELVALGWLDRRSCRHPGSLLTR